MSEEKDILQILVQLRTIQNLRASNIDKNEALVLKCFLLLIAKKQLVLHHEFLDNLSDIKDTINRKIQNQNDENIKRLYDSYIKKIIKKVHRKYLIDLNDVFLPLSNSFLSENSGQLVDSILNMNFDRFSGSDSMQPKELTTIMNYYLRDKNYKSYYNPFSGLSSLAIHLSEDINYFGEEINELNWLLGQIRILIHNSNLKFKLKLGDSIYNSSSSMYYDFIAFNPPFKLKLDKVKLSSYVKSSKYYNAFDATSLIISENFEKLNRNGKMIFVVPNHFLYSNNKSEKSLKKYLVENNYLESIIALPERILQFTGIQINVVVLSKDPLKKGYVKFIDATGLVKADNNKLNIIDSDEVISLIESRQESRLIKHVANKTIVQNQFDIAVNRYVFEPLDLSLSQNESLVMLKDIISSISSTRSKVREGIFIKFSDLANEETTEYSKTFQDIKPRKLRSDAGFLNKNSILLSLIGNSLKPTFFRVSKEPVFYPINYMVAVQVNEDLVDIDFLILELRKEYIQKQIKQKSRGVGIPKISRNELMEIQIIIPSLDEQKRKKYSYQESIIDIQKEKLQSLINDFGIDVADENSFLRHKISGTLRNVRGSFVKLKQIIETQVVKDLPEVYTFKANSKLSATFLDYLNRIERDLNSMHKSVQVVGKELNLQEIQLQPISLLNYMKDYVDDIKNRALKNFSINLDLDEEQLKTENIKDIIIQGDKEILHQIFDNIIENAEKHAFINNEKNENRIEIQLMYDFESQDVQVDFTNTGNPLPENYSYEDFTRRGSKSGPNAGTGIGGWFISQVMKRHNGTFGFTDETGPEGIKGDYATTIELTFPIEIKV